MAFPNPHPVPGSVLPGTIVGDHIYFDDFHRGGFTVDLGLSSESDPGAKFSEVADAGEWLVTRDAAPTITVVDDEPGGVLRITTGSSANDFCSCQLNGEGFKVTAGKDIYCEMRFKFDDTNDTRWFFGLATTDVSGTTIGPILDGVVESIGFRQNTDTGVDIFALLEDNSTETTVDTGINVADDVFQVFAFHVINNQRVKYYIDGKEVANFTTNIPDGDAVTASMEIHSPTASSFGEVDYMLFMQVR